MTSSQCTGFSSNYLGTQVESPHGFKLIGTCPSYKPSSWTIFHPENGTLRSGGTALSPELPTPPLTPAENQYCVRLADWWLEWTKEFKQKAGDTGAVVHQISVNDASHNNLVGRVHRLLKDASPHAPPSGYFDCTVEVSNLIPATWFNLRVVQVLSGHHNDNGVYSLYVTDYTRNELIPPVNASWCAPALSDLVFKIEMWMEAAIKGPEMKPAEYYEIKNVRIKESAGGYWEGSFSEVKKLRKLDEEELEEEPTLIELLKYVPAPPSDAIPDRKF